VSDHRILHWEGHAFWRCSSQKQAPICSLGQSVIRFLVSVPTWDTHCLLYNWSLFFKGANLSSCLSQVKVSCCLRVHSYSLTQKSARQKCSLNWAWWCIPIIPAPKSLRQEDCMFKASLCYVVRQPGLQSEIPSQKIVTKKVQQMF
jgi:hypothetical protein